MKQMDKAVRRLAGGLFVCGLVLRLVGGAMGGRAESRQYEGAVRNTYYGGDWGPVAITADGIRIGGLQIDSDGISGLPETAWIDKVTQGTGGEQIRESGELSNIIGIDVDIDCGDIWVQKGDICSVVLSWNLYNYAMDYRVENGVLKIESESGEGVWEGEEEITCRALITIPNEMNLEELEFSTELGDITVDVEGVTAVEAELSTELGDVHCVGLTANELQTESSLGDVTVHFPKSTNLSYHLETSLGECQVNHDRYQGPTETSRIDPNQKYFVEASSSLGNVTLLFGTE